MSWFWCNYIHMCIKYFQHAVIFIPEVFWMGGKKGCLFRFIYGSDNYTDKCYYHKLPGH